MPENSALSGSIPINLLASLEANALIESAADSMGSTVSDFILQSACDAAWRILGQKDTLMLSQEAFQAFMADCERPAVPNAALCKLMSGR